MAYSAGAIIVNTKLDNSDTIKGARVFKRCVESLVNAAVKMGHLVEKSGNGYTKAMQDSVRATQDANKQLDAMCQRYVEIVREMNRIASTEGKTDRFYKLSEEAKALSSEIQSLHSARQNLGGVQQGFEAVGDGAKKARASIVRMATGGAWGFLKKLASGAKNVAIQLAKLAGRAVRKGLEKIGELAGGAARRLFGLGRSAKQAGGGLQMSLKNMLRYGLGIRSLFVLFNRLRSTIKEGFGELEKYDPRVKAALASLNGALGGLKGSLASAFAPILTAIAPALTTLINLLTRAFNAVGMFMAAITGQDYYMAARGVEAIGDAASGSSGSVKDLKRQLAGFDELNILSANSGGGGGGSSSGGASNYTYDKQPISEGISNFVQQIKELFAAGEYEAIGRVIADGINGAIQKVQDFVKWDNIGPTVTKWMDTITGTINGLFDGINWKNLGKTLADGLNTIINTATLWFKGIKWEKIGIDFGDAINSLIANVSWKKLGVLLSLRIGSLISIIKGAVTNIEWGNAGEKFAEALNGFFSNRELWKDLGDTIDGLLQGILDFTNRFIIEFDAVEAANRIRDALGRIDWPTIASKFWETVKNAFNKGGNFLKALLGGDVYSVNGDPVEQMWDRWNGSSSQTYATSLGATVAEALSNAIKTVLHGVADFVKNEVDWTSIGETLSGFLVGIDWTGVATALWNAIVEVSKGFGTAIIAALFGKDSTIYKNLVESGNGTGAAAVGGLGMLLAGGTFKKLFGGGGSVGAAAGGGLLAGAAPWLAALGITGIAGVATGNYIYGNLKNGPMGVALDEIAGYVGDIAKHRQEEFQSNIQNGVTYGNVSGSGLVDALLWLYGGNSMLDKVQMQNLETYKQITESLPNKGDLPPYSEKVIKALNKNREALDKNTEKIEKQSAGAPLSNLASILGDSNFELQAHLAFLNEQDQKKFQDAWRNFAIETNVNFLPAGAKQYVNNLGGYLTAAFKPGTDTTARVGLQKAGWSTLDAFVGTTKPLTALVGLIKDRWDKLSAFVGTTNAAGASTPLSAAVKLVKNNFDKLSAFVGTTNAAGASSPLSALIKLAQSGWTSLGGFVGTDKTQNAWVALRNSGWQTIQSWIGISSALNAYIALQNSGWPNILRYLTGNDQGKVTLKVSLEKAKENSELRIGLKKAGGIITAGGRSLGFADGGYISGGGAARWWNSIPKYAHGTLFAAGEAGPEVVGHIGGRTEVLNKSQLAQVMQAATYNGMIRALSGITFKMPAMATGGVMPYEVSAQIARTGQDIQRTLDANNEDLIQTIISVAGQIVAALNANRPTQQRGGTLTAQQVINEINRQTLMFGASPLKGV